VFEPDLDDLVDLAWCGGERRADVGDADDGMQRETADEHVNRGELAEHAHGGGIDADFLGSLTQRGLRRSLARVGGPPGQADLAGMTCQRRGAHGQWKRNTGISGIQAQQRRGIAGTDREFARAPAAHRRNRHEAQVCVGAGQRSAQPFAQSRFEIRQLHAAIVCRFQRDRAQAVVRLLQRSH